MASTLPMTKDKNHHSSYVYFVVCKYFQLSIICQNLYTSLLFIALTVKLPLHVCSRNTMFFSISMFSSVFLYMFSNCHKRWNSVLSRLVSSRLVLSCLVLSCLVFCCIVLYSIVFYCIFM